MEHHKISKLLNDSPVLKIVTRKWIEGNDWCNGQCSVNKDRKFKTPMVRSGLCDYIDAYIVVKGTIDLLTDAANENKAHKRMLRKNNALFGTYISKIKNKLIENDLYIVMPNYNLLKYSKNNYMTSESLWNYHRDEIDGAKDNASEGKSFVPETKIKEKKQERPPQPENSGDGDQPAQLPVPSLNIRVTISLKYLSTFERSLNLPLINFEVEHDLLWAKYCVFIEANNNRTGVDFKITSTKLYVLVVTLSIIHSIKFLEHLKQLF